MTLFIGIPLIAFVVYDMIRRGSAARSERRKSAELEAELARLRAQADETPESGS